MSIQEPSKNPRYRPDIDGLRALAIILVVVYHAFPTILPSGFIGVDVFFVISGYLISTIIYSSSKENSFSFSNFYLRRINRIFPALITVLITCFAIGWFTLLADEYKQLGKHIAGGAGFISNLILWNESGYFDSASHTKPLLHLWSLAVEEQFYFIWPVIVWASWKFHLNLMAVAGYLALISLGINIYQVYYFDNLATTFFLPHARFWELIAGAILAQHTLRHPTPNTPIPNVQSALGLTLIFIGVVSITSQTLFPGYWALLPVIGTVLFINAGPEAKINRLLFAHPIVVWIGLISYPLYLWHWPALVFARITAKGAPTTSTQMLAILSSLALAALTYLLIERPIRFGKHRKTKTVILCFLMLAVGFVGFNTYARDGLTFRLNQIQFRLPPVLQSLGQKSINNSSNTQTQAIKPIESPDKLDSKILDLPKKQIWLWGDSYAGHLLAGYQSNFGYEFEIIKLNSNGCPPILDLELSNRRNCSEINKHNFERIRTLQPHRVILAANWTDYDWKKVDQTIKALQQSGYNSIDVIGPAPQWNDSLYKQLYLNYLSTKIPEIPYRMQFGLNQNFLKIEPRLNELAIINKARYISIVKILCDDSGCITRFGDTSDTLASFDGGHFTEFASKYVVSKFPAQ
jgi:peptidoglycan/LPS O-acetylase OafA/YrhL